MEPRSERILQSVMDPITFIFTVVLPNMIPEPVMYTLTLAFSSLALGFPIGIACAIGRVYGPRLVGGVVETYVDFTRGVPMITLLFIVYYGLPDVGILLDRTTTALFVYTFITGAWQSEYFRSSLQSVESGQMLAAQALGLTKVRAFRYVILPQALRFSLEPWSNEVVFSLKSTSLVFTIGAIDLTASALFLNRQYARPFEIFFVLGIMYLILVGLSTFATRYIRNRYKIPGFE